MNKRQEDIEKLRKAPVDTIVKLRSSLYIPRPYDPSHGSHSICAGCSFATQRRGIPDCPYWRSCVSPYRPDGVSVIFVKYVKP